MMNPESRSESPEQQERHRGRVEPVEIYTLERRAEFLLSNAVDAEDHALAADEVRRMGLDPEKISHVKPQHP